MLNRAMLHECMESVIDAGVELDIMCPIYADKVNFEWGTELPPVKKEVPTIPN